MSAKEDFSELNEIFEEVDRILTAHLHKKNSRLTAFFLRNIVGAAIALRNEDEELENENFSQLFLRIFSQEFIRSIELSLKLARIVEETVALRLRQTKRRTTRK